MFSPFGLRSWLYNLACAIFLFLIWLIEVYRATRSLRPSTLASVVNGEPVYFREEVPEGLGGPEEDHWNEHQDAITRASRLAPTIVRFTVKGFIAVIIIPWEITIVY